MRNAELLAVLASNQEASTALYPAWKIILRNQFHDVIPGSSIHEVYEDSREEYAQAEQMIKTVNDQSLNGITRPEDGALTVFNTSSWKQSEVITQNGKQVLVQDLPPFTARTIGDEEWSAPDVVALPNQGKVETEFYQILWAENGHLTSIYDRSAGRELLQKGTAGNVFQLFEDKPREFDAWELEASFADKMDCVTDLRDISIEQDAFEPLFTIVLPGGSCCRRELPGTCFSYLRISQGSLTRGNWKLPLRTKWTALPTCGIYPLNRTRLPRRYILYGSIKIPPSPRT